MPTKNFVPLKIANKVGRGVELHTSKHMLCFDEC